MAKRVAGGGDAAPLRVAVDLLCRGNGKLYAKLRVRASSPFAALRCAPSIRGVECPGAAYPFSSGQVGACQCWVLVLPLVDAPVSVEVWPDDRRDERKALTFGDRSAKWLSRLNYRLRGGQCLEVRDFERPFLDGRYQVHVTDRFDADDGVVWRFFIEWMGNPASYPEVSLRTLDGAPLDAALFPFEFQQAESREFPAPSRLHLSACVDRGCNSFLIVADDDAGAIATGFTAISAGLDANYASEAREKMKSAADDDAAYRSWLASARASQGALERQRANQPADGPLFSVFMYGQGDGAAASATAASIRAQSYSRWELLVAEPLVAKLVSVGDDLFDREGRIRAVPCGPSAPWGRLAEWAQGAYVAFVECGSALEPDALHEMARAVMGDPAADYLYCDEDVSPAPGVFGRPVFRTRFDLDGLYTQQELGGLQVVRRSLLGDAVPRQEAGPAIDAYAMSLRAVELGARFAHVPRVLCHRPRGGCAVGQADAAHALQAHLDRRGIDASVETAVDAEGCPAGLRVRYAIPNPHPLVSIVIPNKDHVDVLDGCIRSIIDKSTYDAYEILVVENNSERAETFEYYDRVQAEFECIRIVTWPDEFNYSKVVNFGAEAAAGEYLLLLNNDTEVLEGAFIEEMLGPLQRPEVGVVGAKLLFRDGLVQHAGMAVGPFDALVHVNQNLPLSRGGYLDRAVRPGCFTAVTGACQMVRASTFKQLGGYDEAFAVGFNDADFCLRAWEAGQSVVCTPYALLHHFEFTSRGRESADSAKLLRWKREQAHFMEKWPEPFVKGDPFTNPNLKRDSLYYQI